MTRPIYVAIDTPDIDRAKQIAGKVKNHVGGLKLGLEFFCANGRAGVRDMGQFGLPIFLDLKLHDIPNTVAKAIQTLRPLEPAILTVHNCPLCRETAADAPLCTFYAGTFQRLFQVIVAPATSVRETACRAMGAPACTFRVDW